MVCDYKRKEVFLNPIRETKVFVCVLTDLEAQINELRDKPFVRISNQINAFYIARNWNAHCGEDPHPYQRDIGRTITSSILLLLLVLWDQARRDNSDALDTIYPRTDSPG